MPIIKQTMTSRGLPAAFHIIDYVECFKFGSRLAWRGRYRSYASVEAYRFGPASPLDEGVADGVPYQMGQDPINDFEQACVAHPACELAGGDIIGDVEPASRVEVLRIDQWARVKAARDRHLAGGLTSEFGVFDTDMTSIVNLLGASATAPAVGDIPWILADNTVIVLTPTQLQAVGQQMAAFRASVYAWGAVLRQQIEAADEATVKSITWSTPPP